jgi:hypothetical protein
MKFGPAAERPQTRQH